MQEPEAEYSRNSAIRLLQSGTLTAEGRALVERMLAHPAAYVAPPESGRVDPEAQPAPPLSLVIDALEGQPGGAVHGFFDADGRIRLLSCTPALMQTLGIEPAEMADALRLGRRLGVQDADALTERLSVACVEGERLSETIRLTGRDGRVRWMRMVVAFAPPQGERTPFAAIFADVTGAHQTSEALVRSDAAFRAMLRGTRSAFALIDPEHRLLWFNDVAVQFAANMAWGEPELGARVFEVFDRDFYAVYLDLRGKALAGRTCERRMPMETAAGRRVVMDLSFRPVRRPDGEMFAIGFSASDVTRQVRAEEAVVASDRILARLPLGVATVDGQGVIRRWRAAAPDMFDLPPAAAEGLALEELLVLEDRERVWPAVLEALAEGRELRIEVDVRRRDGALIPIELALSPTDHGEERAVVVLEDVTARRALQRQVVESQKMEAVGLFAAGLAHDFNNLLAAIVGHTAMLDLDLPKDDPLRTEVAGIEGAAERAATLVRSMLGLARQRSGPARTIDAVELVRRAMPLFTRLAGAACPVTVEAGVDAMPVRIDPVQFEQVLVNLVVNARDASPDGGRIHIGLDAVALAEDEARALGMTPGPGLCCAVYDVGQGMAPAMLERIFEPFFTTKGPHRGTGLGLAICRQILRGCGGAIRVESTPGQGTRVRLYLPRSPEPAVPVPESEGIGAIGRGAGHLLLVEDVAELRDVWARLLRRLGYRVTCAMHGGEAIGLLDAGYTFDLLVSDVVMPGVGGLEVARRFRGRHPRAPILLVSAYPGHSFDLRRLAAMGAELLAKPISGPALARRIHGLLAGD